MVHGYLRKQDIKLFLNTDRRALTFDKKFLGLTEVVYLKLMKVVLHKYGARFIVMGL